jgi:ATP-dependent helicase HrpB
LYQAILSEGISILNWTDEVIAWRNRLLWLSEISKEESFPDFTDVALLDSLEDWLFPFDNIKKREDFKKLNLLDCLKARLTWQQTQRIDLLAPEAIKVPSGFTVPLTYFSDGRNPVLAVRLQEMFGLTDTPTINEGKNQVLLHLLSPGYKPVQVTQDLRSFWKNTYPDVRKELRIRYQKHHWPEDPWTAEAVRGTKRNLKA